MIRTLGYILLLTLSPFVMAQDIPDFKANYLVKLNGIQAGELSRSLTTFENGLRQFNSITQAKGIFSFFKPDIVEESSQWRLINNQVQPERYLFQRTGGKKEKTLEVSFDWPNLTADIDDKKHPWQLKIEPNTLDKLVYQISLMRDLQAGKKSFMYQIADGGKLKTYDIRILGEEVITTPLGKIKTIKLMRKRENDKDRQTTLWCAPDLYFLPVKLEHVEKGTEFVGMLRSLRGITYDKAFSTAKVQSSSPLGYQ